MKKGAIITAIVLLSAGLLIFVGGLFMGGSFRPVEAETKTYPVTEPFTDIHIETQETDIVFLLSTDGTCSVEGAETEKVHLNVSVENGALTVTTVDERTWVDRLIPHVDQPMQIRLPETAYKTLSVESHTGDVTVPDSFAFEQVRITASTGDVTCGASSEDAIEITAGTGDITLDGVRAKTASLAVSTGRITVRGASVSGDVIVSVSTGKIELDRLTCSALRSEGSTGDATLKDVIVKDTLWIKRSTGDVTLERCDAATVRIETDTGDVSASLLSEKIFVTKTNTGKVRIPDTQSGGRCEISTSTGDIRIELVGTAQP